jgi:hypothetical protein
MLDAFRLHGYETNIELCADQESGIIPSYGQEEAARDNAPLGQVDLQPDKGTNTAEKVTTRRPETERCTDVPLVPKQRASAGVIEFAAALPRSHGDGGAMLVCVVNCYTCTIFTQLSPQGPGPRSV